MRSRLPEHPAIALGKALASVIETGAVNEKFSPVNSRFDPRIKPLLRAFADAICNQKTPEEMLTLAAQTIDEINTRLGIKVS